MSTTSIIIIVCIAAIILFIAYRYIKVHRQNKKLNERKFERIKPLLEKLEHHTPVTSADVFPYAENLLTRHVTFDLLKRDNLEHLFPKEYYSLVRSAESQLASWLEFPTELGTCPDEIEHIKRVTINFDGKQNYVHYEVFKYRVNEPHWAAKNGWSLGVVGPFFDDSEVYHYASCTFSRIDSNADKVSAEEEAEWVHKHISLKRM